MKSIETVIIETRLELISRYLDRLKKSEAINLDDYLNSFEAFIELGNYQIITPELAKQIAPSSGLRNRLVHEYDDDDIDPNQVFKAISFALQQYPLYIRQIKSYLISLEQDNG